MIRWCFCPMLVLAVLGRCLSAGPADDLQSLRLVSLPPLPDAEGFAGGYLGISADRLIFAGGANFPQKKPWEGGTKVWSAKVFSLPLSAVQAAAETPGGTPQTWQCCGALPEPLGYGVSATFNNELIIAGGSSAAGHSPLVTALRCVSGQLHFRPLPPLPQPLANHCGTLVGTQLFIFGGQKTPASLAESRGWKLDLAAPQPRWNPLPDFPGAARILAAAAAVDQQFWVIGGAELLQDDRPVPVRRYLNDAWKLDPVDGWVQLPSLPQPSVAAPSPLPVLQNQPLLPGGDDGSQVGQNPATHRGFPRITMRFTKPENRWQPAAHFDPAVVTAPTVNTPFGTVIASGEIRPGIRTPAVWLLRND